LNASSYLTYQHVKVGAFGVTLVGPCSMASLSKLEIIKKYPIGGGLEVFRDSFGLISAELGYTRSPDAV